MVHQKQLFSLLGLMALVPLIGAFADTPTPPEKKDNGEATKSIILREYIPSKRPRVPSNQGISCWYGEGFLTVSFPDNTNFMEVIVADEEENGVCADVVYPESPTIILPPSTGETLSVTCTTDLGAVYSGWIEY